ncbi:hypothetical protein YC2023_071990 [Brassica napus]
MRPSEFMACPPAALTIPKLSPASRHNRLFPTSPGLTKLCVAPVSKSTWVSTPPIMRVPNRDPHQNPLDILGFIPSIFYLNVKRKI